MDTFFSHTTALQLLRIPSIGLRAAAGERAGGQLPAAPPSAFDLRDLMRSGELSSACAPVPHFLTSAAGGSRHGGGLVCHTWTGPFPPGAAVEVRRGIFCASPEFLPVLMAPQLTILETAVLLSELMGLYAICPDDGLRGMFQRDAPLTTPDKLAAFLDEIRGARGAAIAREALGIACVQSGSPRETKLALRLGLKPSMGGYGLDVASMNEPLEVARIGSEFGAKGIRKPDIAIRPWGGEFGKGDCPGVVFEYDGGDHLAPERVAADIRRGNELKAMGVKEYHIDKELYRDIEYMDQIVAQARKDAGYPRQRWSKDRSLDLKKRRIALYRELEMIDGVNWGGKKRELLRERAGATIVPGRAKNRGKV